MVEVEHDNTKAIAGTALGFGIGSAALNLLGCNGGLNGILGGWNTCGNGCGNQMVNRYEAGQSARIAELETEVKLRDANTYTLGELNKMRNYVDAKFDAINGQLCQQAVVNAQITANISCMQNTINVLSGLTKTVIPIDNVCPAPMPALNSWTAPTAGA